LPRLDLQIDRGTEFTAWYVPSMEVIYQSIWLSRRRSCHTGEDTNGFFHKNMLVMLQNLSLIEEQMKVPANITAA